MKNKGCLIAISKKDILEAYDKRWKVYKQVKSLVKIMDKDDLTALTNEINNHLYVAYQDVLFDEIDKLLKKH